MTYDEKNEKQDYLPAAVRSTCIWQYFGGCLYRRIERCLCGGGFGYGTESENFENRGRKGNRAEERRGGYDGGCSG